jgi:anti-anti-sigma factor
VRDVGPRRRAVLNPRAAVTAVAVSLVTTVLVLALHDWYPSRAFTFLYLPMVAVLAFTAGRGPSLFGALVSLLGAWYVLLGPGRDHTVDTGLVVFTLLFAASVVVLGEAMVRLRGRTQAARDLAAIVESSDDAIFSKSLDAVILTWNAGAERMYGYTAAEATGRPVAMLAPPDHAGEMPAIMARLARGERVERYESVRIRKDGTRFDVSLAISPVRDGFGRVVAASTIARDITERKRQERQQQMLIEAADIFGSSLSVENLLGALAGLLVPRLADWCAIDLVDEAGRPQSVTVKHRDPAKVALARRLQERTRSDERIQQSRRRIIESGRPELHAEIPDTLLAERVADPEVLEALRGLGLRSSVAVPLAVRDRVIGVLTLVTAESDRRYTQDDLIFAEQLGSRAALAVENARLYGAEAAARLRAEQTAGRIGRLQTFTAALSEAVTPEQVGEVTLAQLRDEMGAAAGIVCVAEADGGRLAVIASFGCSRELTERWRREPEQVRPLDEAMRTEAVVWFPSFEAFQARYPTAEPPAEAARGGARAAVPLMLHGVAIGTMYATFREARRFDAEELEFMLTIGRQCAQAVERARLYAREHHVATTLQRALLPATLPEVPGVRVDAAYMAATEAADVGGDWYDAFRLPDGRLCVAIGDVVGHGLAAAVIMGQVRQAIRTAALDGHDPAKALALANHVLELNRQEGMTTAIIGFFDPLASTFTYAAAGHPGPIVADGGRVATLTSGGLPLGFLEGGAVPTWHVDLAPGALLVLYTDGLIEFGRDAAAGHAALVAAIREERAAASPRPAQAILDRMLAGAQARDDIAIVTIGLARGPLDRLDLSLPAEPSSLRLMRQALHQLCAGIGLDERRAFDLNVAVGEAVNNVVEHAYGAASGMLHLRAYREDSVLRVEVEDEGHWRPERADNPGGRGFTLMRALTDGVHVVTGEKGTVVRLTMRLAPMQAVMSAPGTAPPPATRQLQPAPATPEAGAQPPGPPPEASAPAPLIEVHEFPAASADAAAGATLDVHIERGAPVVTAAGDLDLATIGRFNDAIERAAAAAQGLVVVSLAAVSYFDSHGVRALLRAQQRLGAARSRLAIVAPDGSAIRHLLVVAGLAAALPIFETVEEALAGRQA